MERSANDRAVPTPRLRAAGTLVLLGTMAPLAFAALASAPSPARGDAFGPGRRPPAWAEPDGPSKPPPRSVTRPREADPAPPVTGPTPSPRPAPDDGSAPPSRRDPAAHAVVVRAVRASLPPAERARVTLGDGRRRGIFSRDRTLDLAIERGGDGAVRLRVDVLDPPDLRGHAMIWERAADGTIRAWTFDPRDRRARRTTEPEKAEPIAGTGLSPEDLAGGFLLRCLETDALICRSVGRAEVAGRSCDLVEVRRRDIAGRAVMAVARHDPTPLRIEVRDENDALVSVTEMRRQTRVGGWWRPLEVLVRSADRSAQIRVSRSEPGSSLPEETFSPRRLGRR